MSEPIRCIKATTDSIQDPKMLAVLKAIYGSPVYYHGKFDSHNMFGCGVYLTGLVVKIFHDQNYFIIHNDYDGSSKRVKEILIPIHSMTVNAKELLFENIPSESHRYHPELKYNQWQPVHSLRILINGIKRKERFRITETTLKEIGFEIVEIE